MNEDERKSNLATTPTPTPTPTGEQSEAVKAEDEGNVATDTTPDATLDAQNASTVESEGEPTPEQGQVDESQDEVKAEDEQATDTDTTTPDANNAPTVENEPTEKMLTQSQVNELVGRARQEGRESAMRELYGRYGVSGDDELNDVFGRGQAYVSLDDDFKVQQSSNRALLTENALLKSKVDENRWEDIKAILGMKGMDVTPENIEAEIPTHPEWRTTATGGIASAIAPAPQAQPQQTQAPQQGQVQQQAPAVLRKFGSESTAKDGEDGVESEQERARKLFGLK